jgi:DHA2 family multidrug resistance protein-like MFS transporter
VLGAAPPEKAGAAGSLVQLSSEFGGTLGIAVLGTVGTAVYRAQIADNVPADIPAGAATAAGDSLAGAYDAAATLPAAQSGSLLEPANVAFASGLHTVALIGGLLIGTVAVITAVRLRHVAPMGGGATADAAEEQADPAAEIGKESVKPVA